MKSIRCILLSLAVTVSFLLCMAVTAAAEGEDENSIEYSYEESSSYTEISYELSDESTDSGDPDSSTESHEESPESSYEESSDEPESSYYEESSGDISDHSSTESSLESFYEISDESSHESPPESSDESSDYPVESSGDESSDIQQRSEQSSDISHDESSKESKTESSTESSVQQSRTDESSHEPSGHEESSHDTPSGVSEPAAEQSDFVRLTQPRRDPLNWMASIGTVLPIQKPPPESSDDPYPPGYEQYQSYIDVSIDIGFASDVSSISMKPITEDAPTSIAAGQSVNIRALLVGIIIFALIGMAMTLTLIILLKKKYAAPRLSKSRGR